jgi:hypothetical protein
LISWQTRRFAAGLCQKIGVGLRSWGGQLYFLQLTNLRTGYSSIAVARPLELEVEKEDDVSAKDHGSQPAFIPGTQIHRKAHSFQQRERHS